jgi:hypothetical protein
MALELDAVRVLQGLRGIHVYDDAVEIEGAMTETILVINIFSNWK